LIWSDIHIKGLLLYNVFCILRGLVKRDIFLRTAALNITTA